MEPRRGYVLVTIIVLLSVAAAWAQVARPDLRVNAMYLAKWEPSPLTAYTPISGSVEPNTKVYLVCEVKNGGTAKVQGNYRVSFRIDGAEVGSQQIDNRPDPQLLTKPGTAWTATKIGAHTFQCALDPDGHVTEQNEGNNLQSAAFWVKLKLIDATRIPVKLPAK
jgi:subtilase family serine protease